MSITFCFFYCGFVITVTLSSDRLPAHTNCTLSNSTLHTAYSLPATQHKLDFGMQCIDGEQVCRKDMENRLNSPNWSDMNTQWLHQYGSQPHFIDVFLCLWNAHGPTAVLSLVVPIHVSARLWTFTHLTLLTLPSNTSLTIFISTELYPCWTFSCFKSVLCSKNSRNTPHGPYWSWVNTQVN